MLLEIDENTCFHPKTINGHKRTVIAILRGAADALNTINLNTADRAYKQLAARQIDTILGQIDELIAIRQTLINEISA